MLSTVLEKNFTGWHVLALARWGLADNCYQLWSVSSFGLCSGLGPTGSFESTQSLGGNAVHLLHKSKANIVWCTRASTRKARAKEKPVSGKCSRLARLLGSVQQTLQRQI